MIIALAPEAKNLPTYAFDSIDVDLVDFNAVSAIDTRTELIVAVLHDQQLANLLPPFLQKKYLVGCSQHGLDYFHQKGHSTRKIHA